MAPTIQFDIQMVRGFSQCAIRRGRAVPGDTDRPGHVALQSMPIMNLAEEIGR